MKALKSKSLMSLIYAVLLALPLCAILSRVIYVQSNKNAYQSYSDTNLVETKVSITSQNQLVDGLTYNMHYLDNGVNGNTGRFGFKEISFDLYTAFPNLPQHEYCAFYFYGANSTNLILYWDENGTLATYYAPQYNTDFSFVLDINYTSTTTLINNWDMYNYTYKQEKLDNVFEYSVSQFVSENDFGQLNFFQWYDELLLSNNSHNALYIHFANWYLNYAMLISLMQILFLVLMWFVNFARKLLDRGMNYDW